MNSKALAPSIRRPRPWNSRGLSVGLQWHRDRYPHQNPGHEPPQSTGQQYSGAFSGHSGQPGKRQRSHPGPAQRPQPASGGIAGIDPGSLSAHSPPRRLRGTQRHAIHFNLMLWRARHDEADESERSVITMQGAASGCVVVSFPESVALTLALALLDAASIPWIAVRPPLRDSAADHLRRRCIRDRYRSVKRMKWSPD